jgi:hypothetical protein
MSNFLGQAKGPIETHRQHSPFAAAKWVVCFRTDRLGGVCLDQCSPRCSPSRLAWLRCGVRCCTEGRDCSQHHRLEQAPRAQRRETRALAQAFGEQETPGRGDQRTKQVPPGLGQGASGTHASAIGRGSKIRSRLIPGSPGHGTEPLRSPFRSAGKCATPRSAFGNIPNRAHAHSQGYEPGGPVGRSGRNHPGLCQPQEAD